MNNSANDNDSGPYLKYVIIAIIILSVFGCILMANIYFERKKRFDLNKINESLRELNELGKQKIKLEEEFQQKIKELK